MMRAAAVLTAAFALAYLPHVGHGFIKDDFAWLYHGRLTGLDALPGILLGSVGFYRPMVTLSFGLNELAFGTWSLGYGLVNFAMALACAAMVYVVARTLGSSADASLFASAVWAFNFHGINMAVLWLSGRTALLLTLFSLLAVWSVARRRPLATFFFALLALGSKEEAVVLPLICAAVPVTAGTFPLAASNRLRATASGALPVVAAAIVYAALRMQSGAFTPQDAPAFYRLEVSPRVLASNIPEYLDRSATWSIAALMLLAMYLRQRPRLSSHRSQFWFGLLWCVTGFALTVWIPVRSSLYAVFPSVGVALMVAAFADGLLERAAVERRRRAAIAGVLLPLLLVPVYWSRNIRWVQLADTSAATFAALRADAATLPPNTLIELRDDRSTRASFQNAFGTLYPEAASVYFGGRHQLWIEPPPPEHAALKRPELPLAAVYALQGDRVFRVE